MKKTIAILLSALMVLPILASCGDENETSSEANEQSTVSESNASEAVSKDSSDDASSGDQSDESSTAEESSEPEPITPVNKTIVSVGCSYTKSSKEGDAYEDTYGAELTDGIFAPDTEVGYGDEKLSGYNPSSGELEVVIDLGKEYDNLHTFEGRFLLTHNAGIAPPASVTVMSSIDRDNWDRVGSLKEPQYVDATMGVYALQSKQYVTARYIKFVIKKASAWVFLDELMVYADIDGSGDISTEIEETVQKIYSEENADFAEARKKFEGNEVDRSLTRLLISQGQKYTLKGSVLSRYPDARKLTDGVADNYYESGSWVGFDGSEDVEITLTISRNEYKAIGAISVNAFASTSSKIYLPSCVVFSVSSDNKEFTEIGRAYSPLAHNDGRYEFNLELAKTINAKYIRLTLKASGSGTMMFVDETSVYSYKQVEDTTRPLYSDPEYNYNGKITYFPSTDSDFDTEQNLILNKGQYVLPGSLVTNADSGYNSKETVTVLTDGNIPKSNNIHSGEYFKSNRALKRTIIYDLGASCAVSSFSSVFLQTESSAVFAPNAVQVEISQDAENWYIAGQIKYNVSSDGIYDSELVLDKPVQARYVRFVYPVNIWVGCGELRVIGKKNTVGAALVADSGFSKVRTKFGMQASDENLLKGVHDVALLYHKYPGNGEPGYDYTEEILMPYLAYTDKNGNMTDIMFDGYLFLLSGRFPSGVRQHENSVKSDWEWQLKAIFTEGKNAMALEAAAAKAKKALGLPDDYKYKYYLSIYYPRTTTTSFGDVDGDGKSENCSIFEDREKVIEWYLNLALEYDKNADFKNIELGGFYWFNESIDTTDDALRFHNMLADKVKAKGHDLFWIPYLGASGVGNWADYGFDTACLQPGYVFELDSALSKIREAARIVENNGMCIEMEITGAVLDQKIFNVRYLEYLKGGIYYGYMKDCIHMYYQEMQVYYNACYSTNPMARSIYDYTYQFIKGTLTLNPERLDDITTEAKADTILTATIDTGNRGNGFVVTKSPEHGSVTIEDDGTYRYYPDKGYTGPDSFEYKYSEGLDYSDSCKVLITVK